MNDEGAGSDPDRRPDGADRPGTASEPAPVGVAEATPVEPVDDAGSLTTRRLTGMLGQYATMQAIVAATGIVRNKVVALRLGPAPFGELTQINAIVGTATSLVSFGMSVSLSRNVAKAQTHQERQAFLSTANALVAAASVLACLVMLVTLASGQLLPASGIVATPEVTIAAAISIVTIPILGLQTNYFAMLQGLLDVRGLARQRSLAVIVATALGVPIVWFFGLIGAAVNALLLSGVLALLLGHRCRQLGYRPTSFRLQVGLIGLLASFGLVSMLSGFAQSFSDLAVRAALIDQYGATANGILQAPLIVAGTTKTILLGSIGSLSLATVSATRDTEAMARMMDRLLEAVVPLGSAVLSLLGLLGVPVLALLFAPEFTSGASLFPYILTADMVLIAVWVVGSPFLAMGDRMLWLVLELLHAGTRWLLALALLPTMGTAAVGLSLLLAVIGHLLLSWLAIGRRYHIRIGMPRARGLVIGAIAVGAFSVIGATRIGDLPVMGIALVGWAAFAAFQVHSAGLSQPLLARLRR